MGNIPKPLLIGVTIALGVCVLVGFTLGFSQTLKRGAVDDEQAAIPASSAASSLGVQEAQPLVEPPPPAPKAKVVAEAAASDTPAPDAVPAPVVKAAPLAVPPLEGAPGVPPGTPAPAAPKLPNDLPPT